MWRGQKPEREGGTGVPVNHAVADWPGGGGRSLNAEFACTLLKVTREDYVAHLLPLQVRRPLAEPTRMSPARAYGSRELHGRWRNRLGRGSPLGGRAAGRQGGKERRRDGAAVPARPARPRHGEHRHGGLAAERIRAHSNRERRFARWVREKACVFARARREGGCGCVWRRHHGRAPSSPPKSDRWRPSSSILPPRPCVRRRTCFLVRAVPRAARARILAGAAGCRHRPPHRPLLRGAAPARA